MESLKLIHLCWRQLTSRVKGFDDTDYLTANQLAKNMFSVGVSVAYQDSSKAYPVNQFWFVSTSIASHNMLYDKVCLEIHPCALGKCVLFYTKLLLGKDWHFYSPFLSLDNEASRVCTMLFELSKICNWNRRINTTTNYHV